MREGFFTRQETQSKSRPDGKIRSCASCGLYRDVRSPRMKPYGNFKKKIMIIGEAPGEMEDKLGKPWQGKSGKLLQQTCRKVGIDLFEDCVSVNACHCRPVDRSGNNRTPTNAEIENCRRKTLEHVYKYKPKVIILLGNSAIYSVLAHRWKRDFGSVSKWRGWTIPDQDFQSWICPTFHPSFVERADDSDAQVIWERDLSFALDKVEYPFPVHVEPEIEIIDDLNILDTLEKGMVAIDYETTGLKPHAKGHKIVSCAVADTPNHCYAFLVPENKKDRKPLVNLLARTDIKKIAHNMKFEEAWSVNYLGQPVMNWERDTMLMSHILDNRPGVTSLKFQTYVNFGIIDYSSSVDPYLTSGSKYGNAFNRIAELLNRTGGKDSLLKYNGLDTIYEYRLYEKQLEDILPF